MLSLSQAFIPSDFPKAGEHDKERITKEVAAFLQSQLQCLPLVPAILFSSGMMVFRAWVRLRYLKGFVNLPLSTRARIVYDWSWGRSFIKRQLMRVVRSLVLFCYYERPEVKSALFKHQHPGIEERA